jgi:mono/diheme cytochrome c family protein
MGVTSVTHALRGGVGFSVAALLIALVCGAWKPAWMRPPVVVVLVMCGIGMVGAGEYLREYLRKPWAVNSLVYANDVRASEVAAITANGVLKSAKFLPHADAASPEYGRDLFVLQCGACHAVEGYRGMARRVDGWDAAFAADILQHIHMLRGTMPPFAGDEQDRKALGKYLAGLNPEWHLTITAANKLEMGKKVFDSRCGHCHTVNGSFRPLRGTFEKATAAQVQEVFPALSAMSSNMPDFNAPADQAEALGFYIAHEANLPLPANTAPAQMPTGTNHSRMRRPVKPGESATAMAKVNQNSPAQEVR